MATTEALKRFPNDANNHIHMAPLYDPDTGLFYFPRADTHGSQKVLLVDVNGDPLSSLGNDAVEDNTAAIADATGTQADAAVTTSAAGTISGKLRGIVALLADVIRNSALKIGGADAVSAAPTVYPVYVAGRDFAGNVYPLVMGVLDDLANPGDSVQQTGARIQAYDAVNSLWKRVRYNAASGGIHTYNPTQLPAALGAAATAASVPVNVASDQVVPVSLSSRLDATNDSVNAATIAGQVPQLDNTNVLGVSVRGKITTAGDTAVDAVAQSSAAVAGKNALATANTPYIYDPVAGTFQPLVTNTRLTLLSSAARTATNQSSSQTNYFYRAILVFLNVTVASGTGGLTLSVEVQDSISGTWSTYGAAMPAYTTTGLRAMLLAPVNGIAASGVITAVNILPLPALWRVNVAHADGSSYTYSVSMQGLT